jgi:hypothetical protein
MVANTLSHLERGNRIGWPEALQAKWSGGCTDRLFLSLETALVESALIETVGVGFGSSSLLLLFGSHPLPLHPHQLLGL